MKSRGCFVANSSTMSFVLVGFDVTDTVDPEDLEELQEKYEDIAFLDEWDGLAKGQLVVGKYLVKFYDDSWPVEIETVDPDVILGEVYDLRDEILGTLDVPVLFYTGMKGS